MSRRDSDREDFRSDWSPAWGNSDEREWDDVRRERVDAEGGPEDEPIADDEACIRCGATQADGANLRREPVERCDDSCERGCVCEGGYVICVEDCDDPPSGGGHYREDFHADG